MHGKVCSVICVNFASHRARANLALFLPQICYHAMHGKIYSVICMNIASYRTRVNFALFFRKLSVIPCMARFALFLSQICFKSCITRFAIIDVKFVFHHDNIICSLL